MIQFNLLPDVKLHYLKAQRQKRLVITASAAIASISLAMLVLLFLGVSVLQKKHINDLTKDIKRDSSKLQNTPDLEKILTVQNQLKSLPKLHADKPVASRLFSMISQVTPVQLSIAKLDVDFEQHTLMFNGTADALSTVNQFVDTLKFTTYTSSQGNTGSKPFSSVVLSNFNRADKNATYQVSLNYDPAIFDSAQDIKLVVPKITTTRSETEKPNAIFQAAPTPKPATGGGQ